MMYLEVLRVRYTRCWAKLFADPEDLLGRRSADGESWGELQCILLRLLLAVCLRVRAITLSLPYLTEGTSSLPCSVPAHVRRTYRHLDSRKQDERVVGRALPDCLPYSCQSSIASTVRSCYADCGTYHIFYSPSVSQSIQVLQSRIEPVSAKDTDTIDRNRSISRQ